MTSQRTTRVGPRIRRALLALGLAAASVAVADVAHAAPIRVRVRGVAKLTARASRDQVPGPTVGERVSELVFSGALTDDAGQPLPAQTVTVRLTREVDPHDARVAEALRQARGCDGGTVRAIGPSDAPEIAVVTDEAGRFCLRARLDPDRYAGRLAFAATDLVDGAEKDVTFDLGRRGVALRFDPTPRIVQLDRPHAEIEVTATLDDDAPPRVAPGLALALASEAEELGRAVTDASGRARFVVAGAKLGPPGRGELRASFAGDGETAPALEVEEIERHREVKIDAPTGGEPGVPEDGIPLLVHVATSVAAVGEGSIEARIGDVVVGAAPVEGGVARLVLTFTAQGADALVKLRYVPASPWYEPAGEPVVRVPIRAPSLASKAPMLLAGLAVLAFFLLGRVAGHKRKPESPASSAAREPEAAPRVEVIRRADAGQRGWTGRLVDAHDHVPVRGGRVWIERGTFEGRVVLTSVETDLEGRFSISEIGAVHGNETIAAEARLHARHTQPLPPAGELVIALAQRRRALLASLVAWARRRGAPFDARPEPTPGHVRRAASDEETAVRWADALERAVFGPGEIDARAERAIEALAPNDAGAERAPEAPRAGEPDAEGPPRP